MNDATLWWLAAGVAVALEMLSGTFYLLMLAAGMVAAALAAHAGLGETTQLVVAAVVGGGAVAAWYAVRRNSPAQTAASASHDVNLDIGETVQVERWQADGQAQVRYRGANWAAVHATGSSPQPGPHRIVEVRGNHLVLEKSGA